MQSEGARLTALIEALLLRPLLAPLEHAAGPAGGLLAQSFADILARKVGRDDA